MMDLPVAGLIRRIGKPIGNEDAGRMERGIRRDGSEGPSQRELVNADDLMEW
jgi:hypothetical protein